MSSCTCLGRKRQPPCNRFGTASSQRRAVPLLHAGPSCPQEDASFHPGGLTLAFQLLHPLPGRTLHLKSAPSPRLRSPLLLYAPKSASSSFSALERGALQGLCWLPSVTSPKAEDKTQLLLGDRLGPAGTGTLAP